MNTQLKLPASWLEILTDYSSQETTRANELVATSSNNQQVVSSSDFFPFRNFRESSVSCVAATAAAVVGGGENQFIAGKTGRHNSPRSYKVRSRSRVSIIGDVFSLK